MSRDDAYRLVQEAAQTAWDDRDPIRRAAGEERPRPGDRKRAGPERLSRARARGHGASAGVRRVTAAQATTEELQGELEATLSGLIEAGTEIAYVNLPNIGNLGDNAIYAGARRSLDRIGAKVVLALEPRAYGRAVLRAGDRRARDDRDPRRRPTSATCTASSPSRPPAAGSFATFRMLGSSSSRRRSTSAIPRRSPRFIRLCREHPDFTILARDAVSVERAAGLGFETTLAPDLAFGLGALDRPAAASTSSTWIVREDVERTSEPRLDRAVGPRLAHLEGTALRGDRDQIARRPGIGAPPESRSRAGPRASATPDRADGRAPLPARRGPARLRSPPSMVAEGRGAGDRPAFTGTCSPASWESRTCSSTTPTARTGALFETWTHRYPIARFAESPDEARELARSLDPS